ncbi:helix-turn-helix domain-containing protein [Nocardiopsis composta]
MGGETVTVHKPRAVLRTDRAGGDWSAPSFGGAELHRTLMAALPELTARVTERLTGEVEIYRKLPAEELAGDVRKIMEWTICAFAAALRTGLLPEGAELDRIRSSAAKRAEEGVPVDAVVTAYHVGALACLDAVASAAGPGDLADALAVNRLLVGFLGRVTSAVTGGYTEEYRALLGEGTADRQSLLSALLEGSWDEESAVHAGIRPPACYLVLSLAIDAHPDERAPGVSTGVAARRKVRRLRTELERRSAEPVLSRISSSEGLALVPLAGQGAGRADWDRTADLVRALGSAAGASVTAGAAVCAPSGVPDAARLATELRDLAVASRRPPGLYRLPDLLLEHQLTRPGPALDHLVELLGPAHANPDLLPTLRVHLETDLNRRRTAARLDVHPNTVDYRLRRFTALTGLDIARNHDRMVARAALAALDTAPARFRG